MSEARAARLALPALVVAALLLTLVAAALARGAAPWRAAAGAALGLAAIALTWTGARSESRRPGEGSSPSADERGRLAASLAELAAGDLVRAERAAAELPERLAAALATALAPLEVLAQRIQRSSVEVAGSASAVKRIASELAAGSSQQAASVVEITAAMEELAQTASQIAGNAEAQAELARRGEASGDEGAAAVARAVAGVERLRERIGGITHRSGELERRAQEIFGVLALVEDIARETHLLSFNAAIEAAGESGESGRRFGEVAEEVRRLAARSRDAAGAVRRLLEDFSASIRATVESTLAGAREAERVLVRARETAAAIGALRGALAETAASAREISAGTGEQKIASAQVVQTLRESAAVVQQIAEGLRGFSGAARELEGTAVDVQLLAQEFRLDSPSSLRHLAERWAEALRPLLASPDALERRLEVLLERRPDAECAYVYDPRRSRAAIVAQRALVSGREIPEEIRSGRGFTARPWYRAAVAERRAVVTPVFVSLLTDERVVTAAAPFVVDGEIVAVLGVDINLERWTTG